MFGMIIDGASLAGEKADPFAITSVLQKRLATVIAKELSTLLVIGKSKFFGQETDFHFGLVTVIIC